MGLDLAYSDGQTPLDEDEKDGLLIPTVATRTELDEFEQQNIEQAVLWTLKSSFQPGVIFTEAFIRNVHKKMYGEVWGWAGEFRKTNKNIGVDKWQIPAQLRHLLDDAKYWMENNTYAADELAVRFKHRIVSIHCFSNGNGRHSRLMADIITSKIFKLPVFSWGGANHLQQEDVRKNYLSSIKEADKGNIQPLIAFARS